MSEQKEGFQINQDRQPGFSLLEVIVAIFIFAVGLLALSALQGALTRSMADAKLRTNAVHIAELIIESNRGFTRLETDGVNGVFAYNDIVDSNSTLLVGDVAYNVAVDVTDYYYQVSSDTFTTTSTGASSSSYKEFEVTVSWDPGQGFRGDKGVEISPASIGSGEVKLVTAISATVTATSARVSERSDADDVAPSVSYTPGQRPDIIPLALGDTRFKESLTPEPDVMRTDELVETRFDVITYSQNNMGSQFLRREEFAAVSCECTLQAADESNKGRRPVVWAGDEYAAGHFVNKAYGVSANNKQSSLCDSCCRDHHDGGSSEEDHATDAYYNVYGPFKQSPEYLNTPRGSDHKHYQADGISLAAINQDYLEACRLVRVDGYFRVAQDFRREDQYIFPEDYLDNLNEINTYSRQVTNSAGFYADATFDTYPSTPPCIGANGDFCLANPTQNGASPSMQGAYAEAIELDPVSGDPMSLPSWTVVQDGAVETQQLRSRGVYIDYISDDLRAFLRTCIVDDELVHGCSVGDVKLDKSSTTNSLEILPFFDVQMTKLENWTQIVQATLPIDLSNEALEDANTHSRGRIERIHTGNTVIKAKSHRGNSGFTNTLAIDPRFTGHVKFASLNVHSLDFGGSGGGGGGTLPTVIAGNFTESVTGNPKIAVEGINGATCTLEPKGYTCSVAFGASGPALMVTGYADTAKNDPEPRYACSASLTGQIDGNGTEFYLTDAQGDLLPAGINYDIVIQKTPCI